MRHGEFGGFPHLALRVIMCWDAVPASQEGWVSSGRTGRAGPRMQIVSKTRAHEVSQPARVPGSVLGLCVFPRTVNPLGEEVGEST